MDDLEWAAAGGHQSARGNVHLHICAQPRAVVMRASGSGALEVPLFTAISGPPASAYGIRRQLLQSAEASGAGCSPGQAWSHAPPAASAQCRSCRGQLRPAVALCFVPQVDFPLGDGDDPHGFACAGSEVNSYYKHKHLRAAFSNIPAAAKDSSTVSTKVGMCR